MEEGKCAKNMDGTRNKSKQKISGVSYLPGCVVVFPLLPLPSLHLRLESGGKVLLSLEHDAHLDRECQSTTDMGCFDVPDVDQQK